MKNLPDDRDLIKFPALCLNMASYLGNAHAVMAVDRCLAANDLRFYKSVDQFNAQRQPAAATVPVAPAPVYGDENDIQIIQGGIGNDELVRDSGLIRDEAVLRCVCIAVTINDVGVRRSLFLYTNILVHALLGAYHSIVGDAP